MADKIQFSAPSNVVKDEQAKRMGGPPTFNARASRGRSISIKETVLDRLRGAWMEARRAVLINSVTRAETSIRRVVTALAQARRWRFEAESAHKTAIMAGSQRFSLRLGADTAAGTLPAFRPQRADVSSLAPTSMPAPLRHDSSEARLSVISRPSGLLATGYSVFGCSNCCRFPHPYTVH
ncbi:hypothetical protein CF326_g9043 [Tilletia indica]|nr:hypothetical protein CF326_g9043 [Tilletia indica]